MKKGTSVAVRSMREREAGQSTVSPHPLKLDASMGHTLPMASSLSITDRPTAGSTAGGALAEDRGFFPLSACIGAMAMGQTELRSDWKEEQSLGEAEELEANGASDGRITVVAV